MSETTTMTTTTEARSIEETATFGLKGTVGFTGRLIYEDDNDDIYVTQTGAIIRQWKQNGRKYHGPVMVYDNLGAFREAMDGEHDHVMLAAVDKALGVGVVKPYYGRECERPGGPRFVGRLAWRNEENEVYWTWDGPIIVVSGANGDQIDTYDDFDSFKEAIEDQVNDMLAEVAAAVEDVEEIEEDMHAQRTTITGVTREVEWN